LEADPVDHVASLAELVRDMNAGQVELLLMLDGVNPVYTAPAELAFAQALQSWSDARSFDGTGSLIQPLIEPLYGGKTAHEMLAALSNQPDATSYDAVHQFWSTHLTGVFETAWREALLKGLIPGTAAAPVTAAVVGGAVQQAAGEILAAV